MLPFLFFVSGALGLVYEVLWMRRFTAVFGGTTLAATATLSGFFLGLALGSAAFGARSKTWRRPLRAFGLLEIGVGLGALLVGPILDVYRQLYPVLHPVLSPYPVAFAVVKLLLAMAAVGIPTFCMGGTLPALSEAVVPFGARLGIPAGGLYAINLCGATLGTLAVPFVLLPRFGVNHSQSYAVAGSLAVGLVALLIGSRSAPRTTAGSTASAGARPMRPARLVLAFSALSGFATLALQVLWTRMFALVHENSLYSFAIVVFVFLAGLAGGAALARAGLRRGLAAQRLLAAAWLAAGFLVLVSPRLFHRLTDGLAFVSAEDWQASLVRLLLLAMATLLPATLALGMALPLLMEMTGQNGSAGPLLGRLVAVNTLGAIFGPLLATYLLGPRLGLWWSVSALGVVLVAAAWSGLGRGERAAAVVAAAVALIVLEPAALAPVRVRADHGERLVSAREGSHGTTAVIADPHDRWITVNNSYVLGGAAAADEERWQGHLPLLLHPAPRRVAFLGLGTAITAAAALHHPVERVVALEIVPEVVAAAREDFADVNARVVDDPHLTVVIDDGRNYLAAAPHAFDVIIGDLLVPWRPAEAPLYSQEHFESVRRALTTDGIFCQWLPLYQLSDAQLAIIVKTFVQVFPRTSAWRGNFVPDAPTLALVGHLGTQPLDPAAVDARISALASNSVASSPFLAHPAGLWLFLVGPVSLDRPGLRDAPLNRDSEPWIELLSPRTRADRDHSLPAPELPALLADLARERLEGTPLARLGEAHRAWRAAGAALAQAARQQDPEGKARVLAVLQTLPPELRRALDVEAP